MKMVTLKEFDASYHKAVQSHETISMKYLKKDGGKISVEQLDAEFSESKKDLTKITTNYIDKINEIRIGGELDILVAYSNAINAMENSWKLSLNHADFYAGFPKDFGDYALKVMSTFFLANKKQIREVAREKWKGQGDIFGDKLGKIKEEQLALSWKGRGAWPGRQPRRTSVSEFHSLVIAMLTEKTGRVEDSRHKEGVDEEDVQESRNLSPGPKKRLPPRLESRSMELEAASRSEVSKDSDDSAAKLRIFCREEEQVPVIDLASPVGSPSPLPVSLANYNRQFHWKSQSVLF
jgi:hypothetical protein